jgi:hypothetical protein
MESCENDPWLNEPSQSKNPASNTESGLPVVLAFFKDLSRETEPAGQAVA